MRLKDKPDGLVSKGAQLSFFHLVGTFATDIHLAICGAVQRSDNIEQSALAAAGLADDRGKAAFLDRQIHLMQYFCFYIGAVLFAYLF